MGGFVQIRLLGPLEIVAEGEVRPVRGIRRRAILAALALRPGEVIPADRLVDLAWGQPARPVAGTALQSQISHLRGLLGSPASIRACPPGYLLDAAAVGTDVAVAERLVREGSEAADAELGATLLSEAVSLWRGAALADLPESNWFDDQARRLESLLLQARQHLIRHRLALGEHDRLIPELEALAGEHALDEQLHQQLMLVLYRAGRQADALAVYRRLRRALAEELGLEPGQALRDLEGSILRQDPALHGPRSAAAVLATPLVVPAQLPAAVAAFTGREPELACLDDLLNRDGAVPAVVISAVSGTAGVGKTALAVHWAHHAAEHFPDGQLYVNLRGFDPIRAPMVSADAVRGFLDALGVPAHRLPPELDGQAALYRSMLAGKRILVVLDNARDADQVRPLLPGAPGCLALVTSRNQLGGLIAAHGARPLTLDLLSEPEARQMLARRLGEDRTAAEPEAISEIVTRCARLPLALAVAAARAAARPQLPLGTLAEQLRDAAGALDNLTAGDPVADVRRVFSWSLQAIDDEAIRLFRLLGLHAGPDISAPTAASLAGVGTRTADALLNELRHANLIAEAHPGRYTMHDLLRCYATEQAGRHETDEARRAAIHRMLDHYLHTAQAAVLLQGEPRRFALDAPAPGVTPEEFADPPNALSWLATEHRTLVGAVDIAAAQGFSGHAWRLARALRHNFVYQCHWRDLLNIHHVALAASHRSGDRSGEAFGHYGLGCALPWLERYDEAHEHLRLALGLFRELDDLAAQARVHLEIGGVFGEEKAFAQGLNESQHGLALFRLVDDHEGQATALNNIGWCLVGLGRYREALAACQESLDLARRIAVEAEAVVWDTLGEAHFGLGDHGEAITCFRKAADISRSFGRTFYEANALTGLGDAHQAAGDLEAARRAWRRACLLLDEVGHRNAVQVQAKLQAAGAR
jgi:DNA-binding SARP family transcriptional activator